MNCPHCNKEFKYKCRLQQHMTKKGNCTDIEYRCKHCLNMYTSIKTYKKHESSCKMKDDHVRQMEIRLGITPEVPLPNVCRFCNTEFSRQNNMNVHQRTCKAKDVYQKELENRLITTLVPQETSAMNVTNNNINGTIMNINVTTPLPFGKENREYINKDTVMRLWEGCNRNPEQFVSKLIAVVHTNPMHPENHNVIYSNVRSRHVRVFNGENYELQFIDEVIEQASSNSLDHVMSDLYDSKYIKKILDACEPTELHPAKRKDIIAQARLELYNTRPKLKRSQVAEAIPFDMDIGLITE